MAGSAVTACLLLVALKGDPSRYMCVCVLPVQEPIAMNHLTHAHKNGGWVLLQNIHLTIDWTSGPLEKRIDKLADGAHPDFRRAAAPGAVLLGCWAVV